MATRLLEILSFQRPLRRQPERLVVSTAWERRVSVTVFQER